MIELVIVLVMVLAIVIVLMVIIMMMIQVSGPFSGPIFSRNGRQVPFVPIYLFRKGFETLTAGLQS